MLDVRTVRILRPIKTVRCLFYSFPRTFWSVNHVCCSNRTEYSACFSFGLFEKSENFDLFAIGTVWASIKSDQFGTVLIQWWIIFYKLDGNNWNSGYHTILHILTTFIVKRWIRKCDYKTRLFVFMFILVYIIISREQLY